MAQANLADITIIWGDSNAENRRQMRAAMVSGGYRDVRDCRELNEIEALLRSAVPPDLLIVSAQMGPKSVFDMIHRLRHGDIGQNPFVPVILFTWRADPDLIRGAAECGVDDILAAPISPADLFNRIKVLVENRKPFVVTSDYIGPDRRKDPRRDGDADGIPLFEVPNTLRSKVKGERISASDLNALVDDVMSEMNDQRLVRHSYQINFLVVIIHPAYEANKIEPEIIVHVQRLAEISEEVGERLEGSAFEHVGELCQTLKDVAASIRENPKTPNSKDVELLKPLSQAILAGFNPDRDSADMASEITSMVSKFSGRANEAAREQAKEQ